MALLTFVLSRWESRETVSIAQVSGTHGVIEPQTASVRADSRISSLERQNRQRLLKRVRQIWIEGVLEHSLHQAALIALDLQEQPDALANPWQLEVQETNLPSRPLPAGTSIVQMYDEADGELLILGEPGAGKTTLLLELTRMLLERDQKGERMPVVFNLSSWAQTRKPLSNWLVEELWVKYQVPQEIGRHWINIEGIIPLLDGLDEVAEEARSACVQAINTFHQHRLQEQGDAPLVVCCRRQEYMALSTRVFLQKAVTIQPLNDMQLERYLQSTHGQLDGLRQALHQDKDLYELAQRPLMLSIFTLAYQGAAPGEFPTGGTSEEQMHQVFAKYAERMFSHRGLSNHFSYQHMRRWLAFIAARMQQHHQTSLYLEHLQPSWLVEKRRRRVYRRRVGLLAGLFAGLITWLGTGLVYGLIYGLGLALLGGFTIGVLAALFVGLVARMIYGSSLIQPKEVVTRSWRGTKRNIVTGLLAGLSLGVLIGILAGLAGSGLSISLFFGVLVTLVFGAIVVLITGFFANQLDDRMRLEPNRGIWRSAQNGLVIGLVTGLLTGPPAGFFAGPFAEQVLGLNFGYDAGVFFAVMFGLFFALLSALLSGLGAFFQHFSLRWCLFRRRLLPWNLVAFLDEAAEQLLLRKVGGGYIFIHRLLLDYFADIETRSISDKSAESGQGTVSLVAMPSTLARPTTLDVLPERSAATPASASSSAFSESVDLLPCGHERRSNACFCSVCGASVTMPNTPM